MNSNAKLSILDVDSGDIDYFEVLNDSNPNNINFIKGNNKGKLIIKEDGIILKYHSDSHQSEIFLAKNSYARVTSEEGEIEIPVKMLAFVRNGVILSMRYIVDMDEKVLTVNMEM